MCGLVGMAGNLEYKDDLTLKRLLLFDYYRGIDSTGLAAVRNNGDVKIAKIASHPLDLFDMKRFSDALNGAQSNVFIGHNRASTVGASTTANAHPFQFEHITGAHNGTLDAASFKRLEDTIGEKFNVDSQAMFAAIAKLGVDETIKLCEEGRDSAKGAWSLVWHNAADGSINFLRNKHRPLWYAYTKDQKKIFWASEWWMIDSAVKASVAGYELWTEPKTGHGFFSTGENIHYKYIIEDIKKGNVGGKLKPKIKEIKGREPVAVASTTYDPFRQNYTPMTGNYGGVGGSTPISRIREKGKGTIYLIGDDKNPLAGIITPERFANLAKHGCQWCEAPLEYTEVGVTIYDKDDMILCGKCSGRDDNKIALSNPAKIYLHERDMPA